MPPLIASAGTKAAEIFAGLTFRLVLIGLVLAMAFNTYADFRISGPLGIGFHWEGWKPKAKRFEQQWKSVEDRLSVSNDSIGRLEKVIADLNADALKRAEAFEASKAEAAEEAQRLERASVTSERQIDRLRALAAAGGKCEVPGELSEALEGL